MSGSFFSQGDQADQARRSLMRSKTRSAGAAIVAERSTWNVEGRVAMTITSRMIRTNRTARIFRNMAAPSGYSPHLSFRACEESRAGRARDKRFLAALGMTDC